MYELTTSIKEIDGNFYIPLTDNLKLLKEQNQLLEENILLKKQLENKPVWQTGIGWLKDQVNIKSDQKIKELILFPYENKLSVEYGGPVKYAKGKKSNWRFEPTRMREFLVEHFTDILVKE